MAFFKKKKKEEVVPATNIPAEPPTALEEPEIAEVYPETVTQTSQQLQPVTLQQPQIPQPLAIPQPAIANPIPAPAEIPQITTTPEDKAEEMTLQEVLEDHELRLRKIEYNLRLI